jgi:hypothetical protein
MPTPKGRGRRTAAESTIVARVTTCTDTTPTSSCRNRLETTSTTRVAQASTLTVQMVPSSADTAIITRSSPGVRKPASRSSIQLSTTLKETPRP